jgi:hypothetical protein
MTLRTLAAVFLAVLSFSLVQTSLASSNLRWLE